MSIPYNQTDFDTSGVDTYESPDPPPVDNSAQPTVVLPQESDIVKATPSFKLAHKKFATDTKVKARQPFHVVGQELYEVGEDAENKETLLQRFHRLQSELQSLQADVAAKMEASRPEKDGNTPPLEQNVSGLAIHEHVKVMSKQLEALLVEEGSRAAIDPALALSLSRSTQATTTSKLLSELEALGSSPADSSTSTTAATTARSDTAPSTASSSSSLMSVSSSAGSVTYALYMTPGAGRLGEGGRLGELERRLADMERLVGHPPPPTSMRDTKSDLATLIHTLDRKFIALDDDKLKILQRRLQNITKSLDDLISKRESLPEITGFEKKVNDVFERMERWDSVAGQVPQIVQRLRALAFLHAQAANLTADLAAAGNATVEANAAIAAQRHLVTQMEASFRENVELIKSNVSNIDARISALQ